MITSVKIRRRHPSRQSTLVSCVRDLSRPCLRYEGRPGGAAGDVRVASFAFWLYRQADVLSREHKEA